MMSASEVKKLQDMIFSYAYLQKADRRSKGTLWFQTRNSYKQLSVSSKINDPKHTSILKLVGELQNYLGK